jgi:hypothetical protein
MIYVQHAVAFHTQKAPNTPVYRVLYVMLG